MHSNRCRLHLLDVFASLHHRDPAPSIHLPPASSAKRSPCPVACCSSSTGAVRVIAQLSVNSSDDDECYRKESETQGLSGTII